MEDTKLTKLKELLKLVDESLTRQEFLSAFKEVVNYVKRAEQNLFARIEKEIAKVRDGKDGRDGERGPKGDRGERGPQGVPGFAVFGAKGADGKDGKDGKDAPTETPGQVRDKLESLDGNERLDKSAIKGISDIEEKIRQIEIRPIGRIGGAKGIGLYVNGAKKLLTAQTLNLVAGTGITLSYSHSSGRNDITITATGSASLTPIAVTGTIDNSNTSFTAASVPNLVIINGAAYRNGHGVTIAGTAITTDSPIGTGSDIYAL